MSNQPHSVSSFPRLRKLWKPAVVTGTGGTTLAIWFEEIIAFAADFIGVILLAILGGLICLFDNFIFKSRAPRREDLKDTTNNGVKK
jgi:purine-cytosine permease-like protein